MRSPEPGVVDCEPRTGYQPGPLSTPGAILRSDEKLAPARSRTPIETPSSSWARKPRLEHAKIASIGGGWARSYRFPALRTSAGGRCGRIDSGRLSCSRGRRPHSPLALPPGARVYHIRRLVAGRRSPVAFSEFGDTRRLHGGRAVLAGPLRGAMAARSASRLVDQQRCLHPGQVAVRVVPDLVSVAIGPSRSASLAGSACPAAPTARRAPRGTRARPPRRGPRTAAPPGARRAPSADPPGPSR